MSFSKDLNCAYSFLKNCEEKKTPNTMIVLFILNECKDDNFFVSNIDIETLSSYGHEKEVLNLPLSCFEIIKIGKTEEYNGIKFRRIYLNYLDKYKEQIESKILDLWDNNDKEEIIDFFSKSLNCELGKHLIRCYDRENKENKLETIYAKMLKVPPNNSYFINKIATNLVSKFVSNSKSKAVAHMDNEIQDLIKDAKCIGSEDKNKCIAENKDEIEKFFEEKFNVDTFDNSFSLGYCLGNFLSNYDSFRKAPNSSKAFYLASLALACGPHVIKFIPKIKSILDINVISKYNIDLGMILDGLNVLWGLGIEFYNIFEYHLEYQKNSSLTLNYAGKRLINFGIAWCFSYFGNLLIKASIYEFAVVTGISLAPFVTVTVTIGLIGGLALGKFGNNVGKYLAEKILGKEEFKLTSGSLYYHYIPEKFRKPGNNPHLQWNDKSSDNVGSYIIECVSNDVDTIMRVMNIPKGVFELPECLGYYDNKQANGNETDFSSDEDNKEKNKESYYQIFKNKKFIGDLIIPYKGIEENAFKIDFIIYRIIKKEISVKEWTSFRDRDSREKLIQDCYVISVF